MITNCHQCLFAMRKGIERGSINTPSPDLQGLDATSMDNNRDGWNAKTHGKVGMATISCHFFCGTAGLGCHFLMTFYQHIQQCHRRRKAACQGMISTRVIGFQNILALRKKRPRPSTEP